MKLKTFKEKLKSLEEFGVVDDDTEVCGFDDNFNELYALDDDESILLDINKHIKQLEAEAKFYEEGMPERAEIKRRDIEALKRFSSKVLCIRTMIQ